MTLTTRLLFFYLGSLIVLLGGFSTTLYFLAKDYLQQQSDERLEAALNTLSAAIEITPEGVEWEPHEHQLRINPGTVDRLAWLVTDGEGKVVARSEQPESDDLLTEASGRFRTPSNDTKRLYWRGERWQAGQRWILPAGIPTLSKEPETKDPKEIKYPVLVITTALPLEPTRSLLRKLMAVLASVSLGVLVIALLAGRAVCRRALRPVQRMAADARAVDPTESEQRITIPNGGDELTDLGIAFNELLDRLHESLQRQKRFTGDASHQLRTPLAALLGNIEIALRRERSPEEYRQALTTAQSKAGHLQRIIESLLYLTRANSEASIPHRERLDLAVWLPQHLATWAEHPRFRDIRVAGGESSIPVMSHPVLLGEIVNILLDNACQYSPRGSAITIAISQAEGTARLKVIDVGPGIAEGDLPNIFSPFFRSTDALRVNKAGVGLGLSIARRLTEAHGGSLEVTSRSGNGCCLQVSLPVAAQEAVSS
jgi:signal transduction histidine kinase